MLRRMSNILRGKPVTQNLVANIIWQFILWGGALLLGAITSYYSLTENVSRYKAIINGALVFLALTLGGYFTALIVARLRRPKQEARAENDTTPAIIQKECPNSWLHDIADEQKKAIDSWVKVVGCRFARHALLRDKPYIEFIF